MYYFIDFIAWLGWQCRQKIETKLGTVSQYLGDGGLLGEIGEKFIRDIVPNFSNDERFVCWAEWFLFIVSCSCSCLTVWLRVNKMLILFALHQRVLHGWVIRGGSGSEVPGAVGTGSGESWLSATLDNVIPSHQYRNVEIKVVQI